MVKKRTPQSHPEIGFHLFNFQKTPNRKQCQRWTGYSMIKKKSPEPHTQQAKHQLDTLKTKYNIFALTDKEIHRKAVIIKREFKNT